MKLTNRKIKKLIRESLQRILFESEDELDRLKAEFDRKVEELGQSTTAEEFNRRNAEIQELEKRINRLTKTMFKEPEEPGEFDFMQTDPIEYPVPYQSGEMTAYEEDPLDRPAMIDVTGGEGNRFSGGPMTRRDMNRREFAQNLGVGIGASALLGKQILDSDSLFANTDPRLKIASDWFDQQFASGKFARYYDRYIASKQFGTSMFSNFDSSSTTEKQAMIFDYITDFSPEELFEGLGAQWEKAGHKDPYEFNETEIMEQMDKLIEKKLKEYYTEEYITGLRNPLTVTYTQLAKMKDPQVEVYVYNYVNMEFEYSFTDASLSTEGAVQDVSDEITDNMIHQLLEDENAGQHSQYEKLYDYLYDYVKGAVGVKFYHSGQ